MNSNPVQGSRRLSPLWLAVLISLVLACTLNMPGPGTPTPYPTYTSYPTYTPMVATQPPVLPTSTELSTLPPPTLPLPTLPPPTQVPPTLTPKPTKTPKPTATLSDKSDIEVLNIAPVSTTRADIIYIDIRNNGPVEYKGKVSVVCAGAYFLRSDPTQQIPLSYAEEISIDIGVGTGFFYVNLTVDPISFIYPVIQCIVAVPDNKDPDPNNNTGALGIP
jgi:hypothetical protein